MKAIAALITLFIFACIALADPVIDARAALALAAAAQVPRPSQAPGVEQQSAITLAPSLPAAEAALAAAVPAKANCTLWQECPDCGATGVCEGKGCKCCGGTGYVKFACKCTCKAGECKCCKGCCCGGAKKHNARRPRKATYQAPAYEGPAFEQPVYQPAYQPRYRSGFRGGFRPFFGGGRGGCGPRGCSGGG